MSFLSSFGNFALSGLQPLNTGDIQIEAPLASPRPNNNTNLPTGNISLGGIPATVSGDVPASSVTSPAGQTPTLPGTSIPDVLSNSPTGTGLPNTASSNSGPISWIMSSRVMSGIVGLICIAGGLFMFKTTRDVIVNTGKKAAEIAA